MKRILLIIILLSPIFTFSQIEKLKKDFKKYYYTTDPYFYQITFRIIDFYKHRYPDSAVFYSEIALKKAKTAEDKEVANKLLLKLAEVYNCKTDYLTSLNYYFKFIENQDVINSDYPFVLLKISLDLEKGGFGNQLIKKYLNQAAEISYDLHQTNNLAFIYALKAKIFYKENNVDSAKVNIVKAQKFLNSVTDIKEKIKLLLCLGTVYSVANQHIKAITYFKKAYAYAEGTIYEGKCLNLIGNEYIILDELKSAGNIFKEAETAYLKLDDRVNLAHLYLDIANFMFSQKDFEQAITYAQKSLKLSSELNMLDVQKEAYMILSKIYMQQRKTDLAMFAIEKYIQIRDLLFNKKSKIEEQLLTSNYQMLLAVKEQQILLKQKQYQELKNNQQKLTIILLSVSTLFLLTIFLVLLFQFIAQKRNEMRLKALTQASLEGVLIHDGAIILEVNDKFCEMSGFERKDLIDKSIYYILTDESMKIVRQKLNIKKTVYYEIPLRKKDGSAFFAQVLSKPFKYKGKNAKVVSIRDLSEIKEVEKELERTQTLFSQMIQTSPDGVIITSEEGIITYASPSFLRIMDFEEENDVLGLNFYSFISDKEVEKLSHYLRTLLTSIDHGSSDYAVKTNKNKKIFIEINGNVIHNKETNTRHFLFIIRNITERRLIENALSESEKRFRQLFSRTKDPIFIQNPKGYIVDANPAAIKLFKYSYQELFSFKFCDLLEDKNFDIKSLADNDQSIETYAKSKDGKRIFIQTYISTIKYRNKHYFLLSVRDMTNLKMQEEHLTKLTHKLMENNRMKDKLFSIIAHDLRGPVGSLKTMLEFIVNNPEEFEIDELMDIIKDMKDTSSHTFDMLENLLAWAKTQQNIQDYMPKIFNLSEIIDDALNYISFAAKQKNIELIKNCNDNYVVSADENMIRVVIRNLLSNAIKFTNQNGKVEIKVENNDDKTFIVKVIDNGIGIPAEKINNLFDKTKFYSTFGTNKEKGAGLGLKLVYDFIKKNKGEIYVESETGKGTKFSFTINKA